MNSSSEGGGWSSFSKGILISVERSGNKFIGKTNKFGDDNDVSTLGYELIVDLDELTKDQSLKNHWWVLELFKKSA